VVCNSAADGDQSGRWPAIPGHSVRPDRLRAYHTSTCSDDARRNGLSARHTAACGDGARCDGLSARHTAACGDGARCYGLSARHMAACGDGAHRPCAHRPCLRRIRRIAAGGGVVTRKCLAGHRRVSQTSSVRWSAQCRPQRLTVTLHRVLLEPPRLRYRSGPAPRRRRRASLARSGLSQPGLIPRRVGCPIGTIGIKGGGTLDVVRLDGGKRAGRERAGKHHRHNLDHHSHEVLSRDAGGGAADASLLPARTRRSAGTMISSMIGPINMPPTTTVARGRCT
jgi:hypothetical protein